MTLVWSGGGLPPALVARLRPTWAIIFGSHLDQIIDRALINRFDRVDFIDTVYQTSFETGFSPNILIGLFLASGLAVQPGKDCVSVAQETLF